MKALKLLLFSIMFVPFMLMAQTPVVFKADDVQKSYSNILDGDTIKGTATLSKVFQVDKPFAYNYIYEFRADSLTDGGSCNISLAGSIDGLKYKTLTSVISWKISKADTAIIFEDTTKNMWKFIKASMTGVGATTRAKLGPQTIRVVPHQ